MAEPIGMPLSPADYVIRELGGLTKTASLLGKRASTVQGWQKRKRIPQDHWEPLMKAAKAQGKTIELRDFLREHEDRAA